MFVFVFFLVFLPPLLVFSSVVPYAYGCGSAVAIIIRLVWWALCAYIVENLEGGYSLSKIMNKYNAGREVGCSQRRVAQGRVMGRAGFSVFYLTKHAAENTKLEHYR